MDGVARTVDSHATAFDVLKAHIPVVPSALDLLSSILPNRLILVVSTTLCQYALPILAVHLIFNSSGPWGPTGYWRLTDEDCSIPVYMGESEAATGCSSSG